MTFKMLVRAVACTAPLLLTPACESKKPVDNFVHVDVYGQMNSRYESILTSRFRAFSRERATLPTGRKILVSEVMEANFNDRLADPAYREQAQMIVLNSEQEAAVDPNLAAEFVHARKACTEQIPCYLLVPNSVSGERRDAAERLLEYLAPTSVAAPPAENTATPAAPQQ